MACNRKLLQLTNSTIGAVAVNANMPLGKMTRRIVNIPTCQQTIETSSTTDNIAVVNQAGIYRVTYTASVTVAAAGDIVLALNVNGNQVTSATVTAAAAGTFPITLDYETRAFCNCPAVSSNLPAQIEIVNTGIALTGGNSNLIISG